MPIRPGDYPMCESKLDAMDRRIERLERENSRLKFIGAVASVGAVLLAAGGPSVTLCPNSLRRGPSDSRTITA